MTDAIRPGVADVAHALAASQQHGRQNDPAQSAASRPAGARTGNEGDSVTLSAAAQEIVRIQLPDGSEAEGRLLTGLKLITPQGQRAEAEDAIRQLMADLGIEGDLEFSMEVRSDGSVTVTGGGAQAAELEAAINADPALQKLMRNTYMSARFAQLAPSMSDLFGPAGEDRAPDNSASDGLRSEQQRVDGAAFTFAMTQGALTTTFVDSAGQRFGGVAPEPVSAS